MQYEVNVLRFAAYPVIARSPERNEGDEAIFKIHLGRCEAELRSKWTIANSLWHIANGKTDYMHENVEVNALAPPRTDVIPQFSRGIQECSAYL